MGCQNTSTDDVAIDMELFKNGYTFFVFSRDDVARGEDPEKSFALVKRGSVRLEVIFGEKLPHTVSILVYAEYAALFSLDKARRVELA